MDGEWEKIDAIGCEENAWEGKEEEEAASAIVVEARDTPPVMDRTRKPSSSFFILFFSSCRKKDDDEGGGKLFGIGYTASSFPTECHCLLFSLVAVT